MANIKKRMQDQIVTSELNQELTSSKKDILKILEDNKEQIKRALPTNIPVDRVIRIVMTAISKDSKLASCHPVSILGCAIQSAQLGLVPDSILGQCYFVPFYNSKKMRYEAQLIIGYRGYNDLIYRSGMVKSIFAMDVREGDIFEYEYGSNQYLRHIPASRNSASVTFDEITHAYAYIYTVNGGFIFKVLDKSELIIARSYSKTREEISVWNTRPNIMAMKTAIRQLIKFAPLSTELRAVDMLESMYESPEGQKWDDIVDIELEDVKVNGKVEAQENVSKNGKVEENAKNSNKEKVENNKTNEQQSNDNDMDTLFK